LFTHRNLFCYFITELTILYFCANVAIDIFSTQKLKRQEEEDMNRNTETEEKYFRFFNSISLGFIIRMFFHKKHQDDSDINFSLDDSPSEIMKGTYRTHDGNFKIHIEPSAIGVPTVRVHTPWGVIRIGKIMGQLLACFYTTDDEEWLLSSPHTYPSVAAACRGSFAAVNQEGKIVYASPAFIRSTGIAMERLTEIDFGSCFNEPEEARTLLKHAFTGDLATNFPLTIRHVDKTLTDVSYNAALKYKRAKLPTKDSFLVKELVDFISREMGKKWCAVLSNVHPSIVVIDVVTTSFEFRIDASEDKIYQEWKEMSERLIKEIGYQR
jgi:hypothetical protein